MLKRSGNSRNPPSSGRSVMGPPPRVNRVALQRPSPPGRGREPLNPSAIPPASPLKVNIIGGGPGGLYLAILLKKADPAHQVTVFERNRADDTFGFGVVFSDAALDSVAQAEPDIH